jgi:ABC-type Na+ transport system ATPase subunit NatA
MVQVKNLTKKYKMGEKEFFALKDESFEAENGEIITILGHQDQANQHY